MRLAVPGRVTGVAVTGLEHADRRIRALRLQSDGGTGTLPVDQLISSMPIAGLIIVLPVIQQMVRVDLRTRVLDVPEQDVISRDNVSVKVNAVVYFRVMNPRKAVTEVENYHYATSQLAQTTLRSVLGQVELDELLPQRLEGEHVAEGPGVDHAKAWHLGLDLFRCSGFNHFAIAQNKCRIAGTQGFPDIMIGDKDADLAVLQMGDDFFNIVHCQRVDAGKRLIEKYEGRVGGQGPRYFKTAFFTARQNTCLLFLQVFYAQFFQQHFGTVRTFGGIYGQNLQNRHQIVCDREFPEN